MAAGWSGRVRILDVGVVVWTVLWIALGALSFVEVRGLQSLSSTMSLGGQSLQHAADALDAVAAVPFVGGSVASTAQEVQRLAARTVTEAENSRVHIDRLSVLILIMGGVIPVICGWIVWALLRRSWAASLRAAGPDSAVPPGSST